MHIFSAGRRRAVARGAVTALILGIIAALIPTAAWAGTVTWSVQPGGADGADGRPWAELTLDAGGTASEHMIVTNHSADAVTFRLSAADGYFTDRGRFTMRPADEPSSDAGTWISLGEESVTVAGGASASVPYTVTVPGNATPGDHLAGVAASIFTGEGAVGVESRVGFRVITRVTGELQPAIGMTTDVAYDSSWNPFVPGTIDVSVDLENAGNTRLGVAPSVETSGPLGAAAKTEAIEQITEFGPGESRSASVSLSGVWPLFVQHVTITAAPSAPDAASIGLPPPVMQTVTVVTIPWSQLALLLLACAVVALAIIENRRRRRNMAQKIDAAREEGRREGVRRVAALVLAAAVLTGGWTAVSTAPAQAVDPIPSTVDVDVDVSPLPSPTATEVPTTGPESPTPSGSGAGVHPSGALSATGGRFDYAPVVAGSGGLLLVGLAALGWHTLRARRSRGVSRS